MVAGLDAQRRRRLYYAQCKQSGTGDGFLVFEFGPIRLSVRIPFPRRLASAAGVRGSCEWHHARAAIGPDLRSSKCWSLLPSLRC